VRRSRAHERHQLNDPQTLYRRWEDSQWSPFAVDLSNDREQRPKLEQTLRELICFALSSLMVAGVPLETALS
jgi:ribonucleotide reductase beta subunit family protein with ferritin-like domain